jgi:two-component system NarL family sensor kinase
VARLRETVRGLHPAALDHGGLAGAIDSAVERAATRGGFVPDFRVDSRAAGVHDALLISIATELAINASKQAEAEALFVGLTRTERELVLEVKDDGRGMTPDLRESALAAGHIGLASCAERVEAARGVFAIESAPGEGTAITVRLRKPPSNNRESQPGAYRPVFNQIGSTNEFLPDRVPLACLGRQECGAGSAPSWGCARSS